MTKREVLLFLAVLISLASSTVYAASIAYERGFLSRDFSLGETSVEDISTATNAVSLQFSRKARDDYYVGIGAKAHTEVSEGSVFGGGLGITRYTIEFVVQKRKRSGMYASTAIGYSSVDYDVRDLEEKEFEGWAFGLGLAAPVITNKVFITTEVELTLLNGKNVKADDFLLYGVEADAGIAYAVGHFGLRGGLKYRKITNSDESSFELEDASSGIYASVVFSYP